MQAGRELDALVDEKVMGWTEPLREAHTRKILHSEYGGPPHYSSDIVDAWQVIETLIPLEGWIYGIRLEHCTESSKEHWLCAIHTITACPPYEDMDPNHITVQAKTAPLAICLAALKAVGVEVEESRE